jgi:hypothetical protein
MKLIEKLTQDVLESEYFDSLYNKAQFISAQQNIKSKSLQQLEIKNLKMS